MSELKSLLLGIIEKGLWPHNVENNFLDNCGGLADYLMEQGNPLGQMIANCIEIVQLERKIRQLRKENRRIVKQYDPKEEKINRSDFINCISLAKVNGERREVHGSAVDDGVNWWNLLPSGRMFRSSKTRKGSGYFGKDIECSPATASEDVLLRILIHYAWVKAACRGPFSYEKDDEEPNASEKK